MAAGALPEPADAAGPVPGAPVPVPVPVPGELLPGEPPPQGPAPADPAVADPAVAAPADPAVADPAVDDPAAGPAADPPRISQPRSPWRAVTTRGRVTALVAALAGVLGTVTGWREWIGIAAALAVLLLAAVLMALGRSSCTVELNLPRTRFVVGEPAVAVIVVRNTANSRLLPLRMELEIAGVVDVVAVPSLARGGSHAVSVSLPTYRRAVLDLGPLRAVRGDVFGLIRRVVQWPVHRQVFVHPRTVRPGRALSGFVHDLDGEESTVRTASDLSFHTLREYVPGDDRRFIHWKSTARSGTLQVREFLQTQRSLVAVVLPGRRADYHQGEDRSDGAEPGAADEFEVAVSCAASIVAELVRQRRDVVTEAAGRSIAGVTADGVLDQFSAVEAAADAPDLIFQTRRVVRRNPRASLIVLIFGSGVDSAQVRAAVRSCPAGAGVLAVRARGASSPHPARLTGAQAFRVLTVPDVQALPAALQAVHR